MNVILKELEDTIMLNAETENWISMVKNKFVLVGVLMIPNIIKST